jgi:hypothetical protein
MRLRGGDLQRLGWWPPETRLIPGWCGCSTEYLPVLTGERLVAARPDLGARPDGDTAATVGACRPLLGGRDMTLRLNPRTAALVGETPNAGEARHEYE